MRTPQTPGTAPYSSPAPNQTGVSQSPDEHLATNDATPDVEMIPNVGAFPDELLEDELDEEGMEVKEVEPDTKLESGCVDVLPDINEIMCGELPDAVSDLWGEETDPQWKVAAERMGMVWLPLKELEAEESGVICDL